MAKFKKKKSAPTPGKDEPKKADILQDDDGGDAGPVVPPGDEPQKPETDTPPTEDDTSGTEPAVSPERQGEKDRKLNRLFWMRVGFAVAAGVVATFAFDFIEGEERRWTSIGFMIGVFIVTIIIGRSMRIPFSLSDRKKIVTQGIGSYVFLYLFTWILSYTLVNVGGTGPALPFP